MINAHSRRPLSFEQMEQRLALSAATIVNIADFQLDFHEQGLSWELANQGGLIAVPTLASNVQYQRALDNPLEQGFVDIQDSDLVFSDPSRPPQSQREQGDLGSLISPIAQPQLGDDDYSRGAISVADIFRATRPTEFSWPEEHIVQGDSTATTVADTKQDSWKSISLSRGRDMYFEVAALSEDEPSGRRDTPRLASEIAPLMYQQTLRPQDADNASTTTSTDHSPQSPAGLLPASDSENPSPPAETKYSLPPSDKSEGEQPKRTAQDEHLPPSEHYSGNTNTRDQILALWHENDLPTDEAVALRDDTQHTHSATWPVLAALAASGWIAKSRLSPHTPLSEQVPPLQKR